MMLMNIGWLGDSINRQLCCEFTTNIATFLWAIHGCKLFQGQPHWIISLVSSDSRLDGTYWQFILCSLHTHQPEGRDTNQCHNWWRRKVATAESSSWRYVLSIKFCIMTTMPNMSQGPPPNFISEVFFLTLALNHYGYQKTINSFEDLGKHLNEMQTQLDMLEGDGSWRNVRRLLYLTSSI